MDELKAPQCTDGPQKIHSAIRTLWLISSLTSCAIGATATIVMEYAFLRSLDLNWRIPVVTPIFWILTVTWSVAMIKRRWASWLYEVTDREVVLKWGVWNRVERHIPRDRVQHVDITSGPLARKLGLAHVHLYVAGAHGAVGAIPGLTPEEADDLRRMLVEAQAEHV